MASNGLSCAAAKATATAQPLYTSLRSPIAPNAELDPLLDLEARGPNPLDREARDAWHKGSRSMPS